ncbi:hypothetical protein DL96DRAFT_1713749 [Flagelloscypha sp. PMI_526]|nr:hypothetical protein DL96DRAFT_1713749 [Flagelloscypha sp. PMI_526]
MGFLRSAASALKRSDDSPGFVKRRLQAYKNRRLPPLPVDVAQTICELAAGLDEATARSLSVSSKDIREWVVPILFRRIEIRNHRSLMRLKALDVMARVAPNVRAVSIYQNIHTVCAGPAEDFRGFLDALPKLTHIQWPMSLEHNEWSEIAFPLPLSVTSVNISQEFMQGSNDIAWPFSSRSRVTHIMSALLETIQVNVFTRWPSLTHIFFEIYLLPPHTRNSVSGSTFPVEALPASIVLCILMDNRCMTWGFRWAIDQALVDLVLGDTNPRVVFGQGEIREDWLVPGKNHLAGELPELDEVRIGLQDAILYHDSWKEPTEAIWEKAEDVRKRRSDIEVRRAVLGLLDYARDHPNLRLM